MSDQPETPKQGNGCLLKIVLSIGIIFMGALIQAVTTERRSYGSTPPINPIVSIFVCGSIMGLLFWKPNAPSKTGDSAIKPLQKDQEDDDSSQT